MRACRDAICYWSDETRVLVGDRAPFVVGGCVAGGVGAQERCGGGSAEPSGGMPIINLPGSAGFSSFK